MVDVKKVRDVFSRPEQDQRQPPDHLPRYRSAWMLADVCGVTYTTIRRWAEQSPTPHGTVSYRGMRWWSPEDARWFIDKAMTAASEKKTKWQPL